MRNPHVIISLTCIESHNDSRAEKYIEDYESLAQVSLIERSTRLRHWVEVLLHRHIDVLARHRRRVVVYDLPLSVDKPPHVREASLHRLAAVLRAGHEGVHAGMEVGVGGEALHGVGGDLADRQALYEVLEVAESSVGVADEVRRHGREEGEIRGRVEGSGLVVVPCLQGRVPRFEVRLIVALCQI